VSSEILTVSSLRRLLANPNLSEGSRVLVEVDNQLDRWTNEPLLAELVLTDGPDDLAHVVLKLAWPERD
jgi:hypothetical protein